MVRATLQRNSRDGLQTLVDGLRQYPSPIDDADAVVCPTLLVTADQDLLVSRASATRLADALGATHVTIEDCGHTVPIEAADRWREHVLAFTQAPTD
jgi:pimeloyl-ACP methyl ester carboxylesterase